MHEHAMADTGIEACGVVTGTAMADEGGVALRYVPMRNVHASRLRFEMDSLELLRLDTEAEDRGEVFWAIFHSHVASPAVPSPTDIAMAALWPGTIWILRSLTHEPSLRAWRIEDGERVELAVEIA
jgi:proteasome lid subunit RPN8/RPN11